MKELIENLKNEILGKEMSLSDLDNTVQNITGSTTSLFDYEFDLVKKQLCLLYKL